MRLDAVHIDTGKIFIHSGKIKKRPVYYIGSPNERNPRGVPEIV
jgi:hypothetical protein